MVNRIKSAEMVVVTIFAAGVRRAWRRFELRKAVGLICLLGLGLWSCAGERQVPAVPPVASICQPQVPEAEEVAAEDDGVTENEAAGSETAAVEAAAADSPPPRNDFQATVTAGSKSPAMARLTGNIRESKDCYPLKSSGGKAASRASGRCEPQSLPYARCRSGITSCKLGRENGPLTWFACEKKNGNTTNEPQAGSILIMAANPRHNMKTGHVMYVEEVIPLTSSTSKLILSHTNYDRQCSQETNIEAVYDRKSMTFDIRSGAWKAWGRKLKLAGFIRR